MCVRARARSRSLAPLCTQFYILVYECVNTVRCLSSHFPYPYYYLLYACQKQICLYSPFQLLIASLEIFFFFFRFRNETSDFCRFVKLAYFVKPACE